ncbi:MAG: hypothetical protein ABFD69_04670 [Candidatus Sumerlaeia bacterium]
MHIQKILVGLLLAGALIANSPRVASAARVEDPEPGATIRLDGKNSLAWVRPVKTNPDGTTSTLDGVELRYLINGERRTWTIAAEDFKYPVSSRLVYEINYFSPREAWMISHLGKRMGGAVLLDLEKQRIEKGYAINGPLSISPDRRHIAYTYPIGERDSDKAVFVDNVVIYPAIAIGFNPTDDPAKFIEPDGWAVKKPSGNIIASVHAVKWDGDDKLVFLAELFGDRDRLWAAQEGKSSGRFVACEATGLKAAFSGPPSDPAKIKLVQRDLTPKETVSLWREAYDEENGAGAFDKSTIKKNLEKRLPRVETK